jgi:signal transduction histidine kinase
VISIESNGHLAVHVDDDGPGIAEPDRATVVRRFVRLDEGRARDVGGAGLGLAVASDVAAAHGGALTIGDSPLGGARVTITLPGTETT